MAHCSCLFPYRLLTMATAWEAMPSLVITQVTLKTLYEIVALPVTIRVVKFTKAHDHEDVFDRDITYNIFKINKL